MKNIKEASNTLMSLYDKLKEAGENRVLGISDTLEKILNDNISKFDLLDIDLLFDITLFRITKDSNLVTIDNISLYYEFMSFDDVLINIELLNNVLFDRYFYILTHFKEIGFICEDKNVYKSLRDWEQIQFKNKHIKRDGYKYYEISFFDIKDTLKPIDEYIEEIKQSEAYKEYIAKKA